MPVIGVGGGIASGKTTVCKFFEKWGAHIVDADEIGKEVVEKNPALLKELSKVFGDGIFHDDGTLDRRRLGHIVFHNENARRKLNAIVHPTLLSELTQNVRERLGENREAVVVIDAALLLEWDLHSLLDVLLVVETTEEKQTERLIQAAGLTRKEAQDRIQAQSHFKEKRTKADFLITNNATVQELEEKAKEVWEKIKTLKLKIKNPEPKRILHESQ